MEAEDPAGTMSTAQRYLTLMTVVLGSSLYGTALLTTSTILPQMQGALSATQDEIAWVMTFNILATAVVTPMTGWLVSRFGSKRVMVWSVGMLHAGDAAVRHGAIARDAGAVAHPAGRRRGAAGAAVAVDPVCDLPAPPAFDGDVDLRDGGRGRAGVRSGYGGYLAEAHSWRWSFYMLVPIGIAATIGMAWTLPSDSQLTKVRFDWTGFIALATALAAIQLVLARGVAAGLVRTRPRS